MSKLIYEDDTVLGGIFDTDFYKFTMCNSVLEKYPDAVVKYKFTNRNLDMTFSNKSYELIKSLIKGMGEMTIDEIEFEKFTKLCPQFSPMFFQYIKNYRFDIEQIKMKHNKKGELKIEIKGPWHSTILWEVPLMAVISFAYFKYTDTDWNMHSQDTQSIQKAVDLFSSGVQWIDFGTRRRRNYDTQDQVIKNMNAIAYNKGFIGTSNIHLAMKNGVQIMGTLAHEFIMGVSALESLRYANRFSLEIWEDVNKGYNDIALTDTFGTDAFLKDFKMGLAKSYSGVRHDSGCPNDFTQKMINHYLSLGIHPKTKSITYSDGLDVESAIAINMRWGAEINCVFGIGTFFSNDFKNSQGKKSKPLNMVIKLYSVNNIDVVKLSDTPMKATGADSALRIARHTFFNDDL